MKELKTAIVISGMHRSGTSSIAGVVSKLGASMPAGKLLATKADNPRGFFESEKINLLNDRILTECGTNWSDWRVVNNDWPSNPKYPDYLQAASRLLDEEYGASRFIFLKDPRFSKILPFWVLALANSGFRACHVIPVRHPDEVAASLGKLHAVTKNFAKLSWARHLLDAEFYSRNQPRVFVFWQDLLDDWERAAVELANRFEITWPSLTDQVRTDIDQFVGKELQHHRKSPPRDAESRVGNEYVDRAFEALALFAKDPASVKAAGIFDAIRADFLRTERIYGPAFADTDVQIRQIEKDRDQANVLLEGERRRTGVLAGELTQIRSALEATSRDRNSAKHRIAELALQLEETKSRLDATAEERDALGRALDEKSARATELEKQLRVEVYRLRLAQNRLDELRHLNVFRRIVCAIINDEKYLSFQYLGAELDLESLQLSGDLDASAPIAASLGLREILLLNGVQFLVGSYGRLLKRQPDESGLSHYLPRLLEGAPKIQILNEIAASKEARDLAINLAGLRSARFMYRLANMPLLGPVVRLVARVEGNSAVDRRLRSIEQTLYMKMHQPVLAQSWSKLSV
jgi:hypothetical protein